MKRLNPKYYSYKPRSVKRLEQRNKRNLFLSLVSFMVIGFTFIVWGLPGLINSLSIFNKFKPVSKNEGLTEVLKLAPPVFNIPFEATNSSTINVTGYSSSNIKVEIYLNDSLIDSVTSNSDGSFQVLIGELIQGQNTIYGKTVDESGGKSLASKTIKVLYRSEKPTLEIFEPTDNFELKGGDKKVLVRGQTDPGNSILINNSIVILGSEGKFSFYQNLNDGDNIIIISASNSVGNITVVEKSVKYSP